MVALCVGTSLDRASMMGWSVSHRSHRAPMTVTLPVPNGISSKPTRMISFSPRLMNADGANADPVQIDSGARRTSVRSHDDRRGGGETAERRFARCPLDSDPRRDKAPGAVTRGFMWS
jgi:hypothetical protein